MRVALRWAMLLTLSIIAPAQALTAQLYVNGILVINSSYQPTGNTVLSQPGAQVTIRNDFNADVIIRLRSTGDDQTILAEETISAESTETHAHGQGVGTTNISAQLIHRNG